MKNKTNFLSLPLLLMGLFLVFASSCEKEEEPGPITVENSITPTTVENNNSIQWTIKVTNLGGKVEIDRVHVKEEFISGWAEGQGTFDQDISITNKTIEANSTETILDRSSTVYNTGTNNIVAQNTVTVYSNGGDDTDEVTYTITTGSKKSSSVKAKGFLGLFNKD